MWTSRVHQSYFESDQDF